MIKGGVKIWRQYWAALQENWPLVWKLDHRRIVKAERERLARDYNNRIEELRKELQPIIKGAIRVQLLPPAERGRKFRILAEFDERMVYDSLIHGNSSEISWFLGESVGIEVANAIRSVNRFRP